MPAVDPNKNARATNPRATNPSTQDDNKPVWPLPGKYKQITDPYKNNRGDHLHDGIDIGCPRGAQVFATQDGKVVAVQSEAQSGGYGNYVRINHGQVITGYAHLNDIKVKNGQRVTKGDVIGHADNTGHSFGDHLHFNVEKNGSWVDPNQYLRGATSLSAGTDAGDPGGGDGTTTDLAAVESIAKASAFSTFINVPGILDRAEAYALRGERSLMNDQPILPFIEQLCRASLRNFQSMPNGNFFAFFPDYFGGLNHRTPYWEIEDIEILDATMQLSDDALATHVYVVGDVANFDGVNLIDQVQSSGVVTLFSAFQADFLSGNPVSASKNKTTSGSEKKSSDKAAKEVPNLFQKDQVLSFLRKYGARPYYEAAPMVRSPYFEAFLAYQTFMLMWSRQFITTFTFTYMPELYPGGIVSFPSHGIQCYIDEVEHTADYATGFTTRASLSAPAAITSQTPTGAVRTGRVNAYEGMIRAGALKYGGSRAAD